MLIKNAYYQVFKKVLLSTHLIEDCITANTCSGTEEILHGTLGCYSLNSVYLTL